MNFDSSIRPNRLPERARLGGGAAHFVISTIAQALGPLARPGTLSRRTPRSSSHRCASGVVVIPLRATQFPWWSIVVVSTATRIKRQFSIEFFHGFSVKVHQIIGRTHAQHLRDRIDFLFLGRCDPKLKPFRLTFTHFGAHFFKRRAHIPQFLSPPFIGLCRAHGGIPFRP